MSPATPSWWAGSWNYHYRNEAFHNNNPNGLPVGIMEHYTDGTWNYVYNGNGYVEICHGADYTEPGCRSRSDSYTLVIECQRRTGSGC